MSAYRKHDRVHPAIGGKSRTKQAHKDETDINIILRKHEKGLVVDHLNKHQGQYGDFIDAPDYHTALNRIHAADEAFMEIPADIRAEFDNDPAQFLEFVQNPENLPSMREMGLAPHETTEAPPGPPPGQPAPNPAADKPPAEPAPSTA